MMINKKTSTCVSLVLVLVLTACGGSSGGNLSTVTSSSTAIPDSTGESTIVSINDVYDPSGSPINQCSAPYWENYSGIYQGTISVLDTSQADTSLISNSEKTIIDCDWDVEISLVRRYYELPTQTRSFCEFEAYIEVQAYPTPDDYIERWENDEGEPQERTIKYLECASMTRTVYASLNNPDRTEVSNPTYPNTATLYFDEISTQNGLGKTVNIVPTGNTSGNSITSIDFTFDGIGGVTLPAATRVDPIWFTNINKVSSDLDL